MAQLDNVSISIYLDYVVGSYQAVADLFICRLLDVLIAGLTSPLYKGDAQWLLRYLRKKI